LANVEGRSPSASARAFADLTTDPALLALLVGHVGKSQPTRNSDEDNTAKPEIRTQTI
jgi:hypothetical protein